MLNFSAIGTEIWSCTPNRSRPKPLQHGQTDINPLPRLRMEPVRLELRREPVPRIRQQGIHNDLASPPFQTLSRVRGPEGQIDAAEVEREGVSGRRSVSDLLEGDAAEAVGVEGFEDRGRDLDGDDDADVLPVSDGPAVSGCGLYGPSVGGCAFVERAWGAMRNGCLGGRGGRFWGGLMVD